MAGLPGARLAQLQACCSRQAAVGKPTAGYAAGGRPIAGFLQLAGLQQGLPQQAFHGQVCYSRFATTRFPGTGLLQQACHNKVSKGRFATAGLQSKGFQGQVRYSRFATARFRGAGLSQQACKIETETAMIETALFQPAICDRQARVMMTRVKR